MFRKKEDLSTTADSRPRRVPLRPNRRDCCWSREHTAENEYGLTPLELAIKMNNDLVAEIIAAKAPQELKRRLLGRHVKAF
jgi:hypothetical protein